MRAPFRGRALLFGGEDDRSYALSAAMARTAPADDTGPNAEMKCLSEIAGIMEGNY